MAVGWWVVAAAAHAVVLVLTAFPPFAQVEAATALGAPTWHHNASLLAAVLMTAVFWRRMTTDRRFLGLGVLVTTILALASAFLILYLKQDLKDALLKDWAKFWHVAWSWFALAFFLGHTWVNRVGWLRAMHRVGSGLRGAAWFWLPNLAWLIAIPLTWSDWGARTFTDPRYIPMTLWTWLAFLVPIYGAWLISVLPANRRQRRTWSARPNTQNLVGAWLIPMTVLANVSGLPILYFATKDTSLKYVAKYWHTWPSIAMAILVFAHTIQFWPAVRNYSQRNAGEPT